MDDHPLAVDVAHLEERCLRPANACSVEDHQHGPVPQVGSILNHARDSLRAQHHRQLSGTFGKIVGNVSPLQRLLVENAVPTCALLPYRGKLLIAKQVCLQLANLVGAQPFR